MKEKLTQFFDTDFHYVEVGVRKETDHQKISEMVWYARQRAWCSYTSIIFVSEMLAMT